MAIPAIAWSILSVLLNLMKGPARDMLVSGIKPWYKRCLEDESQANDLLARLVAALLQVDVSDVKIEPTPTTNSIPIPPEVMSQIATTLVTVSTGKSGWDQGMGGA